MRWSGRKWDRERAVVQQTGIARSRWIDADKNQGSYWWAMEPT